MFLPAVSGDFYVFLHLVSEAVQRDLAGTFSQVKSPSGEPLCATDEPDQVDHLKKSEVMRCASKCLNGRPCQAFNFNDGKCDRYHRKPTNYTMIPGCVSQAVKGLT